MKTILNQQKIDILKIYLDKKIVGKVYEYGEKKRVRWKKVAEFN